METTLLIMAAGIGSRFGGGIKQLEPVDDKGHIIMDYSVHDAIEAGFNKVIFIIRRDIEEEFKEVIGDRIAAVCADNGVTVDYAFQYIRDIPGELPKDRTKPWGTGQAVLAAKDLITTPFIVINADDYYGKEGFQAVHDYLVKGGKSCMAGFVLKNTLSDNGGVTRGICKMDADNNLTEVVETKNIVKTADGAEADGVKLDIDSLVSMNMWGLTPEFLNVLEKGFVAFFEKEVPANPLKAEYLIPIFIGQLLEKGQMAVKVLKTNDTWYGMTYREDVEAVRESFRKMLAEGVYTEELFGDLEDNLKAFSKVEFYDRVLWKNYLAVIGVVGTIVTLISFFVTAEDIDRFSEKQLAAFLVAGLVLIFSVMWYSANHRKHAVKMINNTIVRIAEGDIFELMERDPDKRIDELSVIGANDFYDTLVDDRIVARKTLHGRYIEQIRKAGKLKQLESTIEQDALLNKPEHCQCVPGRQAGRKVRYPLGSVVEFENYVLTAFTKFDEDNKAYLSAEEYVGFWMQFWKNIDEIYAGRTLNIPLMGAGITRFRDGKPSKQELLEVMLWTLKISGFHNTYSDGKVNIVIYRSDVKDIDFYHIQHNLSLE